jgi:tRNA threonylcarbamoyladenosine biosynthesis protein TsaE
MTDHVKIQLADAKKTASCGHSLGSTLYTFPLDIHLSGPLGAGKTTFVQGLAQSLGITDPVLSPTYALEQRYQTARGIPFIHIDLYRIDPSRCGELLAASDHHEGIRCIEWADRLGETVPDVPRISIKMSETDTGRMCAISFDDMPLPSVEDITAWQKDVLLPPHIVNHCQGVADVARKVTEHLVAQSIVVRPAAIERAALVHDLLRFVDFHRSPTQGFTDSPEEMKRWEEVRLEYPNMRHEDACATFLRNHGYDALARIVEVHGLRMPSPDRTTIEQKILFYADKRVAIDKVVSIQERFEDFQNRYNKTDVTAESLIWVQEAMTIEKELFPNGPPF